MKSIEKKRSRRSLISAAVSAILTSGFLLSACVAEKPKAAMASAGLFAISKA